LIFNRHRRKKQFLSIRDDENIDQVEVHDQDFDVEFHENIIENIDDIEDFDDLEIISDNEEDDDDNDTASQDDEEKKMMKKKKKMMILTKMKMITMKTQCKLKMIIL